MDIHKLKQKLQGLFSEGLVTIVGSGLSCAEGLPSMGVLGDELRAKIPTKISSADQLVWDTVRSRLDAGLGLEAALHEISVPDSLESVIVHVTGELMSSAEAAVLSDCLSGNKTLRFQRLLGHLCPANPKHTKVITTNYDRLIEFAVESHGWGVDTGFVGRMMGEYNPSESKSALAQRVVKQHKSYKILYRDHVRLYKPHGSLDWFDTPSGIISSTLAPMARRLIITPGVGK